MSIRANKLATILDDGNLLKLPEGGTISLNTRKFTLWLSSPENRSFRFIAGLGGEQSFTARKETSKKGEGDYWYGYRKVKGRLHKRYIGKSEDVTLLRLKEVTVTLDTPATPRQHTERTKLASYLTGSVTSDEVNRLRTELKTAQMNVTSLQSELEAALGESAA